MHPDGAGRINFSLATRLFDFFVGASGTSTTPAAGSVYVDSGSGSLETVVLMSNGSTPLISGTMTRTVVAQPNSENQALLSITFSLTYTYRKHNYTYSMTTLRAPDS